MATWMSAMVYGARFRTYTKTFSAQKKTILLQTMLNVVGRFGCHKKCKKNYYFLIKTMYDGWTDRQRMLMVGGFDIWL